MLEARPLDVVAAEQDEAHALGLPDQLAQPGVVLEGLDAALLRRPAMDRLEGVDDDGDGAAPLGRADGVDEVEAEALGQALIEACCIRAGDLPEQRLGAPVERPSPLATTRSRYL